MNHRKLEVFDPAMCCSTGVCGPSVDPKLVQFAADLKWLQDQGVEVRRFNLAQNPTAFVDNALVNAALTEKNEAALPLLLVDGRIVSSGRYAERNELAAWLEVASCCGGNADGEKTPRDHAVQEERAAACGSECSCHASKASSKMRMVIGIVVLIAAGTMAVRAVTKSDETSPKQAASSFAAPAALQSTETAKTAEPSIGTTIASFAELNTLAAKTDAVYLYLPGKKGASGNPPATAIQSAVKTMEGKGVKCGLFTMKSGSPDYEKLVAQLSGPAVMVLVKGRGTSTITGEITAEKLIQGYVAASRVGGCSGGSCGAGGCK
jgi:hypothetical protein